MIVYGLIVFVDSVDYIVDRFIDYCIVLWCLECELIMMKFDIDIIERIQLLLDKNSLLVN